MSCVATRGCAARAAEVSSPHGDLHGPYERWGLYVSIHHTMFNQRSRLAHLLSPAALLPGSVD